LLLARPAQTDEWRAYLFARARTIDRDGYLADALAFRARHGWVSFCARRLGTTSGSSSGHPALAVSVSLFEVGRTF
jgi:hypothetical protein